jgi:hypothetical protein
MCAGALLLIKKQEIDKSRLIVPLDTLKVKGGELVYDTTEEFAQKAKCPDQSVRARTIAYLKNQPPLKREWLAKRMGISMDLLN